MITDLIPIFLFTLLAAVALVIIRLRDLFAAAMLMGIFSLLSASLFTVMDGVDVAFTEAAVGAGISTVLILAALGLTRSREAREQRRPAWMPLIVVLVTGAALLYGTMDMPPYGDAENPIHHHVADEYIKGTQENFDHIPNVVTVVLASYRGYDTFGEATVIFTAGIGVMLLLWGGRRSRGEPQL